MNGVLTVKNYGAPPVNKNEILRYMKAQKDFREEYIEECFNELRDKLSFRVVFCEYGIKRENGILDLGFCKTSSQDLMKNLKDAYKIVLFCATIGIEADRIIAKYSKISPFKALVFDAVCTERAESLCDLFNSDITANAKAAGEYTSLRFSAGYGDFPLEFQKDIISSLDAARKIGVTLNESLLMSPLKSVTGIIGISQNQYDCKSGCENCKKYDCEYRRNK